MRTRFQRLTAARLLTVDDESVEVLAKHHQSLSAIYRVTVPPMEVTRFALDKRLTYRRADELGIATPKTTIVDSVADLKAAELRYPVILKPAINHRFFPHTNVKALPVDDPSQLAQRFISMTRYLPANEILIQERIPGAGENQFSFCAVCKDGDAYATLVARRTRQYPVEFGNASTFVESIVEPSVERDGRRFLESLGFDGMAEVEFKFDPRDRRFKILDVNPRPWGWHTLGRAAGIDFPYLLWRQMCGLPIVPVAARGHASWFRELTDPLAIIKSANRTVEVTRFVKAICRGEVATATFDFLDPVPFFAELALWVSSGVSRQKKARSVLQFSPIGLQQLSESFQEDASCRSPS